MEFIRARSRGESCYDSGGAAVFARKSIHLNTGFLDRVWSRGQVQDTLPDSAGHVEAINHILIVIRSLPVGAGVNRFFRRKVIWAGSGCAVSGTRCSQSRYPWGQRHESHQVAALKVATARPLGSPA